VGALCVVWVMQGRGGGGGVVGCVGGGGGGGGGGGLVGDFSAAHAIAKILWNFVSASKILFVTRAERE